MRLLLCLFCYLLISLRFLLVCLSAFRCHWSGVAPWLATRFVALGRSTAVGRATRFVAPWLATRFVALVRSMAGAARVLAPSCYCSRRKASNLRTSTRCWRRSAQRRSGSQAWCNAPIPFTTPRRYCWRCLKFLQRSFCENGGKRWQVGVRHSFLLGAALPQAQTAGVAYLV